MAIRKKGGHAVTSVVPTTADSAQVSAAQPNFIDTQGPAANGAGGTSSGRSMPQKKSGKFPPAR